jgi:hypothetical protein
LEFIQKEFPPPMAGHDSRLRRKKTLVSEIFRLMLSALQASSARLARSVASRLAKSKSHASLVIGETHARNEHTVRIYDATPLAENP